MTEETKEFQVALLNKFPAYCDGWSDEIKVRWWETFWKLFEMIRKTSGP